MAGKVVVSTLNNDTGVLATQNGMTGIAKAWVNFNGGLNNTAGVINNSFNVSSITVNGAGDYTINFTTAMPNANYAVAGTTRYTLNGIAGYMRVVTISSVPATNPTAGSVRINTVYVNASGSQDNSELVTIIIAGS
jgi:hypothetical protein